MFRLQPLSLKKITMKYLIIVLSGLFLITACKKKTTDECTYKFGTTVAADTEEAMVTSYLTTNGILTTATEFENTGMYYIIDAAGSSKKPKLCNNLNVKYTGRFSNNTTFDPKPGSGLTVSTGSFTLGGLIEGWNRALPLIGEGGKIRLFIPPALAYGATGVFDSRTGLYAIPPNSMLIFEIELVNVY